MSLPCVSRCRRRVRGGAIVRRVRRVEGRRRVRRRRSNRRHDRHRIGFGEDENRVDNRLNEEDQDGQVHEPELLGEQNASFEEDVNAQDEHDRDEKAQRDNVELLLLLSFDNRADDRHDAADTRNDEEEARVTLVLGFNIVIQRLTRCRWLGHE